MSLVDLVEKAFVKMDSFVEKCPGFVNTVYGYVKNEIMTESKDFDRFIYNPVDNLYKSVVSPLVEKIGKPIGRHVSRNLEGYLPATMGWGALYFLPPAGFLVGMGLLFVGLNYL